MKDVLINCTYERIADLINKIHKDILTAISKIRYCELCEFISDDEYDDESLLELAREATALADAEYKEMLNVVLLRYYECACEQSNYLIAREEYEEEMVERLLAHVYGGTSAPKGGPPRPNTATQPQ